MSSAGTSDPLNEEESETMEQAAEEENEDAANGSDGGEIEEEEDEEEYDSDEKKEKSLIVEGKREKKKVERLSFEMSIVKKEVLTEGKGQKLYDIERVQYFLRKKKCDELRQLHRLLFNRQGTVNMIKKNIGQFNGFPFEKGSDQYKKKEDFLKKLKKDDLKNICGVLDLEKSGVNSELISKIMTFLMKPKSTGKPLPKSKSKPPKGGKKERSSSGSARKSKSRKSNVILTDESSSEEEKKNKEESSGDEKESEEEVEDEEQEDEDEEPPKKVSKKEKAKPKAASRSRKVAKSSNIKKADSSTTKSTNSAKKEKPVQSESEDDSSDDEPLIKKVNKPPTDDDLRNTIKTLLAEVNLEDVTMKQICKKVNEKYPKCDLLSRKTFIKATVKELIS